MVVVDRLTPLWQLSEMAAIVHWMMAPSSYAQFRLVQPWRWYARMSHSSTSRSSSLVVAFIRLLHMWSPVG